jgi:hypothetical protein
MKFNYMRFQVLTAVIKFSLAVIIMYFIFMNADSAFYTLSAFLPGFIFYFLRLPFSRLYILKLSFIFSS